jgi:hypothetical protein
VCRALVRRTAVWVFALVLPASTLVVLPSVAHAAQTPGQRARQLKDDLRALGKAEKSLRSQADTARTALVVGTAKWRQAEKKLTAAKADARDKNAQAAQAETLVEDARKQVAGFAAGAYENPVNSMIAFTAGIGSPDPLSQARGLADLDQAGDQEAGRLSHFAAAKTASDVFARQARAAERKAASLAASLQAKTRTLRAEAKKSTDRLSKAVAKVNAMQARIDKLEAAERARLARLAAQRRAALARSGGGGGGSSSCGRTSRLSYPNGLIPLSALCPLPQSGSYLRADAARAFWRLNAAYRARFGGDMCVNAAYRSLRRQYQLYAVMTPGYAAVPGTSNHGEGIAVDLGCGVNVYGSTQFDWMKANAPRFGFVHPYWAEHHPFEPWHWEYHG